MRDMHCHILPGVDDGARDLQESLSMLQAAKVAGITEIVCTPHVRDPYFDYDAMWDAYELLVQHADGFPIRMGFEVNHRKLVQLGFEWIPYLGFDQGNEFLLELSTHADASEFQEYERTIFRLQGMGYEVIIAHPERYRAIQKDVEVARRLCRMGCKLQASADFITGGRLGKEKGPARRLFAEGLYDYVASDAHRVEHYEWFARAQREFGVGDNFQEYPRPLPDVQGAEEAEDSWDVGGGAVSGESAADDAYDPRHFDDEPFWPAEEPVAKPEVDTESQLSDPDQDAKDLRELRRELEERSRGRHARR